VQKCAKILIYFCNTQNKIARVKGERRMSKQLRTSRRVSSVRTLLEDKAGHVKWPNRGQFIAAVLLVLLLCQVFSIFRPAKANIANSESLSVPSNAVLTSVVENVTILKNAYANVSIFTTVPDSALADLYRRMLAAPSNSTVGEEMPIPENVTENGVCMPVKQRYYDSIKKDQGCWYGFKTWVTDGTMVPRGYQNGFNVSLTALAAPQVVNFATQGTDGLLDIAVGPRDDKSVEIVAASYFDEITFAQLMLKSLNTSEDGQAPEYVCLRTMNIALPPDALLLNAEELEGLSWAVDFGGGTSINAWLTTSNSSIVLTDKTVVSEQNITENAKVLWEELRSYRIFDIKCMLPNTTWISVTCGLNAVDDFEKEFDYTWTDTYSYPVNDNWNIGGVKCTLNSSLTVKPTFSFSCYIGWDFSWFLDPQWFRTWIAASARLDVDFKVNLTAKWTKDYSIFDTGRMLIFPIRFTVLCVPVELDLNLQVKGILHVSCNGSMFFEFAGYAQTGFKAGVQWDHDSGWSGIWETNNDAEKTAFALSGCFELTVRPSIHVIVSLDLYGLIGPFIDFSPYAEGIVKIIAAMNSGANLTWSIKIGLQIIFGIAIQHNWLTDLLGIGGYNWNRTIDDIELAKWQGACGGCSVGISITDVSPSAVIRGNGVTVAGNVTSDFAGSKDGKVDLSASADGGTTWNNVGTTTSDINGTFSFWWVPVATTTTTYLLKVSFGGNSRYGPVDSSQPYPSVIVSVIDWGPIVGALLCKDIVQYEPTGSDKLIQPTYHPSSPINRTNTFYPDDPYIYMWLNVSNIEISPWYGWPERYWVHWSLLGLGEVYNQQDLMNEQYSTIPDPYSGSLTTWTPGPLYSPTVRSNWTCWARFQVPPWFSWFNYYGNFTVLVQVHFGDTFWGSFNLIFQVVARKPDHVALAAHYPPTPDGPVATLVPIKEEILLTARACKAWDPSNNEWILFGLDEGYISLEWSTDNITWNTLASNYGTGGGSFDYNWTPPAAGDYSLRAQWHSNPISIYYYGANYIPGLVGWYFVWPYCDSYSTAQNVEMYRIPTMLIATIDPHVDENHLYIAQVFSGENVTINATLLCMKGLLFYRPAGVAGENITFEYSIAGATLHWTFITSAPLDNNAACSFNWTIPREFSGTLYVRSIWYGDSILENDTYVDPSAIPGANVMEIDLLQKTASIVGVANGANAQVENAPNATLSLQVTVSALVYQPKWGWMLIPLSSVGKVEFYVNQSHLGVDNDTDGDGIYQCSWILPQNWTVFGVLTWEAYFDAPPNLTDSLANSTVTIYRRPHLVVQGMDNAIYYRTYSPMGDKWTKWTALPSGATPDAPASTECENELHIVVRGMDNKTLWYSYVNLTDNSFHGWTMLSGSTPSAPTLTSNATFLALVVRGQDNRIYYRFCNVTSSAWTEWTVLPSGATIDSPAAALSDYYLHIVVRGTDGYSLWYCSVYLMDGTFEGWHLVTGATNSKPTLATCDSLGEDICLTVKGLDNAIYWRYAKGGEAWLPWVAVPTGSTLRAPGAIVAGQKLQVVVTGTDGTSMWQNTIDIYSRNSSGWTLLSGATPSSPTLTN
jgi:hypothetical protein